MSYAAKKEFIFSWEIENFFFGAYDFEECLNSPVFDAEDLYQTSWFLKIYPRGTERGKDSISCFLYRTAAGLEEIRVKYKIDFTGFNGEILKSRERSNSFHRSDNWGWFEYLDINNLNCFSEGTITIQCRIVLAEVTVESSSKRKARTKLGIDRSSFQWNVKNIDTTSWTDSKIFQCSKSMHIDVTLTAPEDSVNISMKKINSCTNKAYFVACKIFLLDANGNKRDSKQSEHFFSSTTENDIWEFPSFFQKGRIQVKANKYLKNDLFTLMLKFSVSNDTVLEYIEDRQKNEFVVADTKVDTVAVLQEDLQRMFSEHIRTDVTLQAENKTFDAHKCLLSSRSPVFAAMFEQDMLENQTGVVNISDVEVEILRDFLNFIYTGTLGKMDYESVSKLLIIAHKYQVLSLQDKCSSFLKSNLSIVNVCDVASVADMIGDETLRAYAVDYIIAHADVILISEDWTRCIQNNTELVRDIFNELAVNTGSEH